MQIKKSTIILSKEEKAAASTQLLYKRCFKVLWNRDLKKEADELLNRTWNLRKNYDEVLKICKEYVNIKEAKI